jgi:trk system potassium uptake protein TrkA
MKIIIAGSGDVGFHLAELLEHENQDIVLIDMNQDLLDYAANHLDVLTLKGDSSSIEILEQADAYHADLVIAVTTSEKNNLVTCILAKKMGAKQTIARVKNVEYLSEPVRETFRQLGVDSIISPTELAANEIVRLVQQVSFTDIFEFEEGKISVVGVTLDDQSPLVNTQLSNISGFETNVALKPIAILRGHETIIPRGDTVLRRNDHIYYIAKKQDIDSVITIAGKKKIKVKNIMILGGNGLGATTAKRLEKDYNVILIVKGRDECKKLAESLENTLIIDGDVNNIDLLLDEGLERMDVLLALTPNSETNIITSLTAKNYGVYKTIARVENKDYTHISQNIGVDTLINKKLIAANNIFRYVRKGRIEAITSLHGVDAEIIEYAIHRDNQLTKKPLRELHFPSTALIGGVIRGENSIFPDGNFQLAIGDKVIVFALPEAISKLDKLFN